MDGRTYLIILKILAGLLLAFICSAGVALGLMWLAKRAGAPDVVAQIVFLVTWPVAFLTLSFLRQILIRRTG